MTELDIQKGIKLLFANNDYHLFNQYIFRRDWESDYFSMTKAGLLIECEVVTRYSKTVIEGLHKFNTGGNCLYGIMSGSIHCWDINGRWNKNETDLDLFLRPIERKVWVVEWKAHNGVSGKSYFDTLEEAQQLCKSDEKYHSYAIIHEATLKPVK